jgi:hypothetical protein
MQEGGLRIELIFSQPVMVITVKDFQSDYSAMWKAEERIRKRLIQISNADPASE